MERIARNTRQQSGISVSITRRQKKENLALRHDTALARAHKREKTFYDAPETFFLLSLSLSTFSSLLFFYFFFFGVARVARSSRVKRVVKREREREEETVASR